MNEESQEEAKVLTKEEALQEVFDNHNGLVEYNLSVVPEPFGETSLYMDRAAWTRGLISETCLLHFCGYFYRTIKIEQSNLFMTAEQRRTARKVVCGGHGTAYLQHVIVGGENNRKEAATAIEYLLSAAEAWAREIGKEVPTKERFSQQVTFLNLKSEELQTELATHRSLTAALMIVNGAEITNYALVEEAVTNYMKEHDIKSKYNRSQAKLFQAALPGVRPVDIKTKLRVIKS